MNLSAKKRDLNVKPNDLRAEGLVPAELYGHGFENLHLAIPVKEFAKAFKEAGETTVIKINIEGEKDGDINVLIHDVVKNALNDEFEHVDLYRLRMDEKTTAHIPFVFVGEAQAVKEKLGLLIKAMQEIEVEALPADLPHEIEIDVTGLAQIGDSISVADLKVSPKVKLLVEPETVIATIVEAKEEEVAPAPEAEVAPVAPEKKSAE